MNNKGFAISGILYTLFVLFLVLLMSALNGLRSKNNYLEKSITMSGLNKKFDVELSSFTDTSGNFPYTGKYVFDTNIGKCYSYLVGGSVISSDGVINYENIKYTTDECNSADKASFSISGVYKFGESE